MTNKDLAADTEMNDFTVPNPIPLFKKNKMEVDEIEPLIHPKEPFIDTRDYVKTDNLDESTGVNHEIKK